jgi:hypothetical protein
MARGWRLVNADDYSPHSPFADGVSTPPGTVSETFWVVSPGLRWLGLIGAFCSLQGGLGDVSSVIIQEVEFSEDDVVETMTLKQEPVNGAGVPASPKTYMGKKITSGTVSDLAMASAIFTDYALSPEP